MQSVVPSSSAPPCCLSWGGEVGAAVSPGSLWPSLGAPGLKNKLLFWRYFEPLGAHQTTLSYSLPRGALRADLSRSLGLDVPRSQAPEGLSQEEPGGARRSQEEPGEARRGKEEPGGARRSQEEKIISKRHAYCLVLRPVCCAVLRRLGVAMLSCCCCFDAVVLHCASMATTSSSTTPTRIARVSEYVLGFLDLIGSWVFLGFLEYHHIIPCGSFSFASRIRDNLHPTVKL
jgi:hypothetical protein